MINLCQCLNNKQIPFHISQIQNFCKWLNEIYNTTFLCKFFPFNYKYICTCHPIYMRYLDTSNHTTPDLIIYGEINYTREDVYILHWGQNRLTFYSQNITRMKVDDLTIFLSTGNEFVMRHCKWISDIPFHLKTSYRLKYFV